MKTVGIITMHRVLNCGSALQAYALQHKIEQLGYKSELIDYLYPNAYHKSFRKSDGKSILSRLINNLYSCLISFFLKKNFSHFYNNHFVLSKTYYKTRDSIKTYPPIYDIYVSGSDQVWNPHYIGNDTTFMLSFTSSKYKISYASSLASHGFSNATELMFAEQLEKFKSISVREELSCEYVKQLSGKDCTFVLDPSMLLTPKEWLPIINESKLKLNDTPFVLVYILGYSFSVYDYAAKLINHVQEKTGWNVKVLVFSRTHRKALKKYDSISNVAPENFLYLINNASLVITDSFHATAFSLNFSRPVYSLIKSKTNKDNRVYSLLKSVGAEDRAVERNQNFDDLPSLTMNYTSVRQKIITLRETSIRFLKVALG